LLRHWRSIGANVGSGRYEAAEDWFVRVETIAQRLRAPYLLARVRLGRGVMRIRRDANVDAARPDLEDALAIARRHGFGQIVRDSASLLGAVGPQSET
jgi:hypothetical protein